MKHRLLICVGVLFFISGCKSSTEPPTNRLGPSITVTSNWTPSLEGGGRWFNGPDTGVWYDASLSFTLDNSSGSTKDVSYTLEIGEFKNGKFVQGGGELFYDGDSIVTGTSKIGTSTTLDITPTIGVGRKDAKDWSYPYGYKLTLKDIATNDSYMAEGSFDGSKPENRFRGIIYTTEASSDSLGLIDGPDDGDWQSNANPYMRGKPSYPNPTNGRVFNAGFEIENRDSVVLTINKTKRSVIKRIISDIRDAGGWEHQIFMDSLMSGQYRLYYHFVDSSRVFNSYGDLKFVVY